MSTPYLRAIVGVEHEVLLDDRDLVVEPRDFVEHLLGDRAAFAAADGLREQQQGDRLVDGGKMLREDLLVLSGQERHPIDCTGRIGRYG